MLCIISTHERNRRSCECLQCSVTAFGADVAAAPSYNLRPWPSASDGQLQSKSLPLCRYAAGFDMAARDCPKVARMAPRGREQALKGLFWGFCSWLQASLQERVHRRFQHTVLSASFQIARLGLKSERMPVWRSHIVCLAAKELE